MELKIASVKCFTCLYYIFCSFTSNYGPIATVRMWHVFHFKEKLSPILSLGIQGKLLYSKTRVY